MPSTIRPATRRAPAASPLFPPLLPGTPVWQENDAAGLREFIAKPLGQLFLRQLFYLRPLVTSRQPDERRIQQDELTGYDACFAEIIRLAEAAPQPGRPSESPSS